MAIDMAVETTHASATGAAFSMTATRVPLAGHRPADAESILCHLIRCVFGEPVPSDHRASLVIVDRRPPRPEGSTTTGRSTAWPILADALEEDGCDDTEMLAHGRGQGPHARGCWVVDRVLGMK